MISLKKRVDLLHATVKGTWEPQHPYDIPENSGGKAYYVSGSNYEPVASDGDIIFINEEGTEIAGVVRLTDSSGTDLSDYYTKQEIEALGHLTETDVEHLVTRDELNSENYATKTEVNNVQVGIGQSIQDLVTRIDNVEGSGNSPTYSNSEKTKYRVGNIPAGQTFENYTFQDLMRDLFYWDSADVIAYLFEFHINADNAPVPDADEVRPLTVSVDEEDGLVGKASGGSGMGLVLHKINGEGPFLSNQYPRTVNKDGIKFIVNEDGSFTATIINNSFNSVPKLDHEDVVLDYVVKDLFTDTEAPGTVTISVHGTNKAPYLRAAIYNSTVEATDTINVDLKSYFSDPNNDNLTFTITNGNKIPNGLILDPSTLQLSGVLDRASWNQQGTESSNGQWSWPITAEDPHGASVSATAKLRVERPGIVATNISASGSYSTGKVVTFPNSLPALAGGKGNDLLAVISVRSLDSNNSPSFPFTKSYGAEGALTVDSPTSGIVKFTMGKDLELLWATAGTGEPATKTFTIPYTLINDQGAESAPKQISFTAQGTRMRPTVTNVVHTANISISGSDLGSIGSPYTATITASFDRGTLTQGDASNLPRAGKVLSFYVNGTAVPVQGNGTSQVVKMQNHTISGTVGSTDTNYVVTVSYEVGATPLDSIGLPYTKVPALPAGNKTHGKTLTVQSGSGYPWYFTNPEGVMIDQGILAKDSLPKTNGKPYVQLWTPEKYEDADRGFMFPASWGDVYELEIYDNADGTWNRISRGVEFNFAKSYEDVQIGGSSISYTKYIWKLVEYGLPEQQYRILFN